MKQHITKEQWEELSIEEQAKLWGWIIERLKPKPKLKTIEFLTIGRLIEFLGDGWEEEWSSCIPGDSYCSIPYNDTLCDDLWKSVKYKIKV